jgi:hypothetical protein
VRDVFMRVAGGAASDLANKQKNNRIKKVKNVFVVRENALAATPAARIKASRTLTSRKFLK